MRALALLILTLTTLARTAAAAETCIIDPQIDHTQIVDDRTILFVMRDRSVYRNRLPNHCFGLRNETEGFSYEPTDPGTQALCSNQVTIRINRLAGDTCQLGVFEKIKPAS